MTSRIIIDQDYCCTDSFGTKYGTYSYRYQSGGNKIPSEIGYQPHAYVAVVKRYENPLIRRKNRINGIVSQASSSPYTPSYAPISYSNASNRALGKLYGEAKGADFNAALSTSEMHQNVKMIGDNARRVAKAFSSVRRGDMGSALRALSVRGNTRSKSLASSWLELQYGWLPLLKDTHEAAKFIQTRMSDPKITPLRVRTQDKLKGKYLPGGADYLQQEQSVRVQMIYYPSAPLELADALGLTDPLSIVWEKLPYSFVLDWFLPVGPWLEAAAAARALKGRVVRTQSSIRTASGLKGNLSYEVLDGAGVSWRDVEMTRTVGPVPPPSLPTFNPLEKAMSVRHALNGVALLANLKRS